MRTLWVLFNILIALASLAVAGGYVWVAFSPTAPEPESAFGEVLTIVFILVLFNALMCVSRAVQTIREMKSTEG